MGAEQSQSAEPGGADAESKLGARIAAASGQLAWQAGAGDEAHKPSGRECVAVTSSDAGGECLYVVGGRGAEGPHNDVGVYDAAGGRGWAAVSPGGEPPSARSGHSAAAVPGVGILVHGGLCEERGFRNDTALLRVGGAAGGERVLDWTRLDLAGEPPSARDKHSAVAVPPTAGSSSCWSMVVFGGFGVVPPGGEDDDDEEEEEEDEDEEEEQEEQEAQPDAPLSLADKLARTAAARRRRERREKKARGPAIKLGWFGDVHVLELDGPGRWRSLAQSELRPGGRRTARAGWAAARTARARSSSLAAAPPPAGRTTRGCSTWLRAAGASLCSRAGGLARAPSTASRPSPLRAGGRLPRCSAASTPPRLRSETSTSSTRRR